MLLITSRAPFGPQERFVIREAEALARQGVEVILSPVLPGADDAALSTQLEAVRVHALSGAALKALARLLLSRPLAVLGLLKTAFGDPRPAMLAKNVAAIPISAAFAELVRARGVDHVHGAWASVPATVAMFAAGLSGRPWSFSAHRWDIDEANLARTKLERSNFARAISERGRRELAAAAGHRPECPRIALVHLGVRSSGQSDERPPAGVDRAFTVATVANLVEKKGHRHLIDSIAALRRRNLIVNLLVAGDGPERPALERQVERLGLGSQVRFEGRLTGEGIDRILREEADAIVLASIVTAGGEYEGIPVALVEGMAAGLPAVATDTGSISELITPDSGFTVTPADAEALADAIEALARSPDLVSRMGAAARDRVRTAFDEDDGAARLKALLGEAHPRACRCRIPPAARVTGDPEPG